MNGGPSGFSGAPVTKALVITSAVFTFVFGIQGRSRQLSLSYQDVFVKLQLWKPILSLFTFSSTPELMFGLYLLYYFRVFERQIGSSKYSVFLLFSGAVSMALKVIALAFYKESTGLLASGPYGLIFASFIPFFFDIPVSTRFKAFGIQFFDKSLIYLAGVQLLFSSWKRSLLSGTCGIIAGSLYRLNLFGIRKMKIPGFISSFFSRIFRRSSGSPRRGSQNITLHPPATARQGTPTGGELDESVARLVSMGFESQEARQALLHAQNDINVATNILIEAQSALPGAA